MSALSPNNFVDNQIHKVDIITPKAFRITTDNMTLAEYTRVISERAAHIANGGKIFIDTLESDPIKIAKSELKQKKSPMMIRRYTTRSILELWSVNEMVPPKGIQ